MKIATWNLDCVRPGLGARSARIRGALGHIDADVWDFFAGEPSMPDSVLIAVLRGFDWLHGAPDSVAIEIRPPGVDLDVAYLAEARRVIEQYLANPTMPRSGRLSETLWAWING